MVSCFLADRLEVVKGVATVTVADQGTGLAPKELSQIWDLFHVLVPDTTRLLSLYRSSLHNIVHQFLE